jgi:hypothetical protein
MWDSCCVERKNTGNPIFKKYILFFFGFHAVVPSLHFLIQKLI